MKNIIHALTIIDKSGSMLGFRSRTIEGINANINALKKEVDQDTQIFNTLLQFSSANSNWMRRTLPKDEVALDPNDFVFTRLGAEVSDLVDITEKDYYPDGGTPLLDAIGHGIEAVKKFHGDKLGDDNLKIIVTIFTDGEENSSIKYSRDEIKKMIEHFQSDGKWTFTFVGCGSFENVSATSANLGIIGANTVAYEATDLGTTTAYCAVADSYTKFTRSVKCGLAPDKDLFTKTS